jgi:hypothetical protein
MSYAAARSLAFYACKGACTVLQQYFISGVNDMRKARSVHAYCTLHSHTHSAHEHCSHTQLMMLLTLLTPQVHVSLLLSLIAITKLITVTL